MLNEELELHTKESYKIPSSVISSYVTVTDVDVVPIGTKANVPSLCFV